MANVYNYGKHFFNYPSLSEDDAGRMVPGNPSVFDIECYSVIIEPLCLFRSPKETGKPMMTIV